MFRFIREAFGATAADAAGEFWRGVVMWTRVIIIASVFFGVGCGGVYLYRPHLILGPDKITTLGALGFVSLAAAACVYNSWASAQSRQPSNTPTRPSHTKLDRPLEGE